MKYCGLKICFLLTERVPRPLTDEELQELSELKIFEEPDDETTEIREPETVKEPVTVIQPQAAVKPTQEPAVKPKPEAAVKPKPVEVTKPQKSEAKEGEFRKHGIIAGPSKMGDKSQPKLRPSTGKHKKTVRNILLLFGLPCALSSGESQDGYGCFGARNSLTQTLPILIT